MGSKPVSQNNTSSTYSPPPNVLANYDAVTQQAQNVASNPYQSYNGNLVAGKTGEQRTGTAAVNSTAGVQNPYNTSATTNVNSSAAAINPTQFSGSQLTQYENPYQSQVVNATQAELNNADAQQASQLQGNAIASGAFGGDRAGIGQAALAGQQDIANNATIAGLNTANFQNAESEFNTQQGVNLGAAQNTAARQLAASQQLGSLGSTAQNEGLTEANAQVNAGTIGQQVAQAQDTANYNQFLQKQAYPFQTTGWLSNIIEGIGSQSGGTTSGVNTQTGSTAGSIVGAGLGLASFLNRGGRVEGDEIRIPRKALGGSLAPYDDMIGGLGGGTYVPGINLPVGHTIPNPSSGTGAYGSSNTNGIGQVANGIKGLGNAFENSSLGDSFNDAIQDAGFYRGGLVRHYEDGGDAGDGGSAGDGAAGNSGDAGGVGNGVGSGAGAVGGDANGGVGAGASTGTVGTDGGLGQDSSPFGGLGDPTSPSSPAAFGLGYATTAQSMTNPGLAMGLAQTANTIGTQDGLGLSDPGTLGFSPSKVTMRASNDDGTVGPATGANDPGVNLGQSPSQAYSATGSMDPSHQAMANNLGMAPSIGQSEAPDAVATDTSFANPNSPSSVATSPAAIAALRAAMSPSSSVASQVGTAPAASTSAPNTSPAAIAALRAAMSPDSVSQPNAPSAPAAPYGFSDSPAAIAALRAAMSPSTNQGVASSTPSVTGSVSFANPGDSSSSVSPSSVPSYSPSSSVSAPAVAAIQSYANPANISNTPVGNQGVGLGLGAAGRNDLGLTQSAANTLGSSAVHPITNVPTNVAPYVVTPVQMSDGSWATSHGGVLTPIATLASGGVARKRYDDGGIVDPSILTDPGIGVSYTDPTLGSGVSGPLSFSQNIPGADNQPTFSTSSPSSVSGQNDPGADNQPSFSPAVVSGLGAAVPRSDALPPQLAEAMTGFSPSAGTQAGNQIQVPSFPNAGMASSNGLGSAVTSPSDGNIPVRSLYSFGAYNLGQDYALEYANQMPQPRGAVNYGGPTVGDVPTDSQGYAIDPNTGARTQPSLGSAPIAPQPVVASNSRNPWMAPAYSGPTPKGPAPDPENYPTTQAGQAQFIRDYSAYAGGKGIDPNFALSVAKAEGLGAVSPKNPNGASSIDIDPQTGKPFSFGPFQLNVKNGLGRAALAAGIDPTDPAQGNAANKFAMDYMATHGIQPWRGDKAVMAYQNSGVASPASDAIATNAGPAQGLGAASVNPDTPAPGATEAQSNEAPNGGGGLLGMFGFHPTDAQRQAMLAAGLGMMAGTSRSGLVNIGQGGLQGLQQYNATRNLEGELGLKQAQTLQNLTAAQGAAIENKMKQKQLDWMLGITGEQEQAGNQKADAVAKGVEGGVTTPTVTAPTVAPKNSPSNIVSPEYDPDALNAYAKRISMIPGMAETAKIYKDQAAAILSGNQMVKFADGHIGYYPGSSAAKADQDAQIEAAKKYAGAETVDPLTGAKSIGGDGSVAQLPTPAPAAPPAPFSIDPETAKVNTSMPVAPPGGGYIQPNLSKGAKLTELPESTKQQMAMDGEFQKDQVSTMRATPTVIARTQAIAQAFKTFQSGSLADKQHDSAALATALGFPNIGQAIMQGSVSGPEWVDKEGVQSVLDTLKSATPRFAQSEFNAVASHGTPNTTNQPQANHEMVAEMLALGQRNDAFMKDWEKAKQQGWASPSAFYESWDQANPVNGFIKSAQRQIGNFVGMDLPPAREWTAGTVYVAPQNMPKKTVDSLSPYGIKPGTMFRYNGSKSAQPFTPVAKSDYFSAQLGQ